MPQPRHSLPRPFLHTIQQPLSLQHLIQHQNCLHIDFRKGQNESSAQIRSRVIRVQKLQAARFAGRESIRFNGDMGAKEIEEFCRLDQESEEYLQEIYERLKLSARGCHKVLKVARTIADLDGAEQIGRIHLCEAAGYRSLENKYWNG